MTTANKQFHDPDMKNESKLSNIVIIQMLVFNCQAGFTLNPFIINTSGMCIPPVEYES